MLVFNSGSEEEFMSIDYETECTNTHQCMATINASRNEAWRKKKLQYTVSNPGLNLTVAQHITADSSSMDCFQIMFTCKPYDIFYKMW